MMYWALRAGELSIKIGDARQNGNTVRKTRKQKDIRYRRKNEMGGLRNVRKGAG